MNRYKNIGYLRVLACLGIVITHLWQRLNFETGKIYELAHYLQHGVYLFFIISGFLGVYTYIQKSYKPVKYWINRLIRILPVYYAIIIYNIILHSFILKDMPQDIYGLGWIRYIFIIHQFIPGELAWRNISFTWTLGAIVLFYLLVPLICAVIKSFRVSVIGLFGIYFLMILFQKATGMFGLGTDWFSPVYYLPYFFMGIVICHAVRENKENQAILLFGCLTLYYFATSKFNSPYTLAFVFSIIMLSTMHLEFKNKYIQNIFDKIDVFSYEIYLGHAVVMEAIDLLSARIVMSRFVVLMVALIGIIVVCAFLYYIVDRPVTSMIKNMSAKGNKNA